MRRRAKCKLCDDIIEALPNHNMVECKCKHIGIDLSGDILRCHAGDWKNFIPVDDDGKELPLTIKVPEPVELKPVESESEFQDKKAALLKEISLLIEETERDLGTGNGLVTRYEFVRMLEILVAVVHSFEDSLPDSSPETSQ